VPLVEVLDAGVEALGVLAVEDEVEPAEGGVRVGEGLGRAHVRVEVEVLAEPDVGAAEAAADGRRERALQREARPRDGVENGRRERVAGGLEGRHPRHLLVPLERDAGRLEHAPRRADDLGADPVAGDEGDTVGHECGRAVEWDGRRSYTRPSRPSRGERLNTDPPETPRGRPTLEPPPRG